MDDLTRLIDDDWGEKIIHSSFPSSLSFVFEKYDRRILNEPFFVITVRD